MSIAPSWDEGPVGRWREAVADLRALVDFRSATIDGPHRTRLRVAAVLGGLLSLAIAVVPAYARDVTDRAHTGDLTALLPSIYLGFLVLAVVSAVASGGGRELVPRDQAVAYPVSATTDHLGALLLAPLNIAWLVQALTLLGVTSYVLGPHRLAAGMLPVVLWLAAATALAQVVAWLLEWVRRGQGGVATARVLIGAAAAVTLVLVATGQVATVLDHSPTVRILLAALAGRDGDWPTWAASMAGLLALTLAAVLAGALPAGWASRRPSHEELRLESGLHPARPNPGSDLLAMLRIDRASVWRSVPLRRGLVVLALMPGAVALAGRLEWDMLTIMPGLVASGGALLFGVNCWCLDARGALWRDSQPVDPAVAFRSRALVLLEVLLAAALVTVALAGARAGIPALPEVTAMVSATVVVLAQVVSASMRWSVARPYAVDLRSARATPAPPIVMVGYSARLAGATTMTGVLFSFLATLDDWRLAPLLAIPFVAVSLIRLTRTSHRWATPDIRARVVATV